MELSTQPIIIEEFFNASISKVWKALTEHSQIIQWYFENIEAFEPEVGFQTEFSVQSTSRSFLHQWKVLEVIPEKRKNTPGNILILKVIQQLVSNYLKLIIKQDYSLQLMDWKVFRKIFLNSAAKVAPKAGIILLNND